MESSNKRKYVTLTIKDKLDIIHRFGKKESGAKLAKAYRVDKAAIYYTTKKRSKIQVLASTSATNIDTRKRKVKFPELEDVLYVWCLEEQKQQKLISRSRLTLTAKKFYKQLTKKDDFVVSRGWLDGFTKRHGINLAGIKREKSSTNAPGVEEFRGRFLKQVEDLGLHPSQVYNAKEAQLRWEVKWNPDGTVVKEWIYFLSCANASGLHALKPLVVGNSAPAPVSNDADPPVHYYFNKSALMTKELFIRWFRECFVPEVMEWLKKRGLPQKAMLLLDRSPIHPTNLDLVSEDGRITMLSFECNNAAVLQPMDQNVNEVVKWQYRRTVVEDAVTQRTLESRLSCLARTWKSLPSSTILASWKKLWPDVEEMVNAAPEDEIGSGDDVKQEEKDREDESMDQFTGRVSMGEAARCFETCLRWAEENDYSSSDVAVLRSMKNRLFADLVEIKQEKVDSTILASRKKLLPDVEEMVNAAPEDEIGSGDDVKQEEEDREDECMDRFTGRVSMGEAARCFETCLRWAEENDYSSSDVAVLRSLKNRLFADLVEIKHGKGDSTISASWKKLLPDVEEMVNAAPEDDVKQEEEAREDESMDQFTGRVSMGEAARCFETCLRWAEENDYSSWDVALLRSMKNRLFADLVEIKQETVDSTIPASWKKLRPVVEEMVDAAPEDEIASGDDVKQEEGDREDESMDQCTGRVSMGEAARCFETCLRWAEENDYSSSDVAVLRSMKNRLFADLVKINIE